MKAHSERAGQAEAARIVDSWVSLALLDCDWGLVGPRCHFI